MGTRLLRDMAPLRTELAVDFPVELRPIVPSDEERLRSAFDLLSMESRLQRFGISKPEQSCELARRLANTDGRNHLAWFALRPEDEVFPGYGGASLWRDPEQPEQAEFSITIADSWQRQGMGTLLFSVLWMEGWALEVTRFCAFARRSNEAVQGWWADLGGEVQNDDFGIALRMELEPPEAFVQRVGYDLHAPVHQVELAGWLQQWIDLVRVPSS